MAALDALILGFFEKDFAAMAARLKLFSDRSGAYHELTTNSLLVNGARRTYIDVLNRLGTEAQGGQFYLNPFEQPNLGVAYLASFLTRRGLDVEIVNFVNSGLNRLSALLSTGPRTVVVTTTYYVTEEPVTDIVKYIRSVNPDVIVIVGGPRVLNICSGLPRNRRDAALRSIGADIYVNDSQGEDTLAHVLHCLRLGNRGTLALIPNILFRDQEGFTETAHKPENNSLNANAVDWNLFNREYVTPTVFMRTARSCPFKCLFCEYPSSAGMHTTSDIDVVVGEIEWLVHAGVKNIIFIDDTFNVPLPRFRRILEKVRDRQLKFNWVSFFRCSNADQEVFDLMESTGCLGVYLGIESGDDYILGKMEKYTTLDKYEKGIHELHTRGILTLASMIVGYPGETHMTVDNTINFLSRTPLDFFSVQLYFHNPMAPIEKHREEFGIEGAHYSWKHLTMDWQEATEQKERVILSTKGPTLLPLYGLSIWAFPYLLQSGLSIDDLRRFLGRSQQMLLRSLGDNPAGDAETEISSFAKEFGSHLRTTRTDIGRVVRYDSHS